MDVPFRVARLSARVPEGLPVVWKGRRFDSGPLVVELDPERGESRGTLDYERSRASAEFFVTLSFPELAGELADLGVDPALTAPIRATLRSEGEILSDHGFALSGACEVVPHPLGEGGSASVLPGT
jgi:hypothetical protein